MALLLVSANPVPAYAVSPGSPVVAMGFDEGQGSVVRDSSPYGNDGVITGAQWSEVGRHGGALRFEADDRVTIADAASLDLTQVTLEAWVRPATTGAFETVVARKAADPATNAVYALHASSDWTFAPPMATGSWSQVWGVEALPTNAWTHLAATFDGAWWRMYVNGVLVRENPGSPLQASDRPLVIGAFEQLPAYGYDGLLDELRVYPRALSALEIQRDRDSRVGTPPEPEGPAAPVLAMGFEDGAGEIATDASTYGNHGTIYGARWTSDGRFGKGLSMHADEGHVHVADSDSLDFTTAFTISAWVKPRTTNQYQSIFSKDLGLTYTTWQLFAFNGPDGSPPFGMVAKGQEPSDGQWWVVPPQLAALQVGEWTHLALTLDGGTARLYCDGVQVAAATGVGPAVPSNGALHIGGARVDTNNENFEGVIDEVRAYDVALSQPQVVADRDTPVRRSLPPARGGAEQPPGPVPAPALLAPVPAVPPAPTAAAPSPAGAAPAIGRKAVTKKASRKAAKRRAAKRCAARRTKEARRACARTTNAGRRG